MQNAFLHSSMKSVLILILLAFSARADDRILRWGGDAEGGAPFVEADPTDPSKVRGFDVDALDARSGDLDLLELRRGGGCFL